jgi:hypothetical protein
LAQLSQLRLKARDPATAEVLARRAADRGNTDALWLLARLHDDLGEAATAERLAQEAANRGNTAARWYPRYPRN